MTAANHRTQWGEELGQTYFERLGMEPDDSRNVSLDLIIQKLEATEAAADEAFNPGVAILCNGLVQYKCICITRLNVSHIVLQGGV